MDDDAHLLRLWAKERRQSAFSALVTRYAGIVFGTALRRLRGQRALAEEAAQNVFVLMATKADTLVRHPCLGAWLHRAAMWQAATIDRNEAVHTRKLDELAAAMHEEISLPDSPSQTLLELDAALDRLAAPDRRVLLMRFFEQRDYRDIAKRLGLSEAAAQKQSSRALQRLATQLRRSSSLAGTGAIAAALPSLFRQPVSAALVERLSSGATLAVSSLSKSTVVLQTLSLMAHGKKVPLTIAAFLALLVAATSCFLLGRQQALASGVPTAGTPVTNSSATLSKLLPSWTDGKAAPGDHARRHLSVREALTNAARGFNFYEGSMSYPAADTPLRMLLPRVSESSYARR